MSYAFFPALIGPRPPLGAGRRPRRAAPAGREAAAVARVMVSEDDPGIQQLYASLLPRYGFELFAVPGGDGLLTLELARRFLPDLLVTDVNKPSLDGGAICRALRADPHTAHIPTLMVTAMDEWLERRRGVLADDYLLKPFAFEMLIYRVATMVGPGPEGAELLGRQSLAMSEELWLHPITGLPGPAALARALAEAGPGAMALELRLEGFPGLVRAAGRGMADALLGRLATIAQVEARARGGISLAHPAPDARLCLVGPGPALDGVAAATARRFIAESGASLARFPQARPPRLGMRLSRVELAGGQ